jgi:hypothetical protein
VAFFGCGNEVLSASSSDAQTPSVVRNRASAQAAGDHERILQRSAQTVNPIASPVPMAARRVRYLLGSVNIRHMVRAFFDRLFGSKPPRTPRAQTEALLEANRLIDQGRFERAEALLLAHAEANSDSADHHFILGKLHAARGRHDLAVVAFRRACAIRPELAVAHACLADSLIGLGAVDEAVARYRSALDLTPEIAAWHNNLGRQLFVCGQVDSAMHAFERAFALDPSLPEAHFNRAIALLVSGDFARGWPEYEWRPDNLVETGTPSTSAIRQWDGQAFSGKRLLVTTEQGFGDTLFFTRFLPALRKFDGEIWLKCAQPALHRLLQSNDLPARVLDLGGSSAESAADLQISIASLPARLGITRKDMPGTIPYLCADPRLVQAWRARLARSVRLKVGVAWSGNPRHANDRFRSAKLSDLEPLARLEGVDFYSLQKDPAEDSARRYGWTDWTSEFLDFADTAAFIENLDLVVSVDTAIVHLAGAMGKPVLLLAPKCPDWRWTIDGQSSPWYPSVRVFQQAELGNWAPAVLQIAAALR